MRFLLGTQLAKFRLTLGEYEVLSTLRRGPMTQATICQHTDHSEPSVSRWLQRLEDEGWVSRRPATCDRRRFMVSLTPSGTTRLDASRAGLASALADLSAGISLTEQRMLGRLHRHIRRFLCAADTNE